MQILGLIHHIGHFVRTYCCAFHFSLPSFLLDNDNELGWDLYIWKSIILLEYYITKDDDGNYVYENLI